MNRLRNFWEDHKAKIILGGALVGGIVIFVVAKKAAHLKAVSKVLTIDAAEGVDALLTNRAAKMLAREELAWGFETLEAAVEKFTAVESACHALGTGEVALFGGIPSVQMPPETLPYTVMYL